MKTSGTPLEEVFDVATLRASVARSAVGHPDEIPVVPPFSRPTWRFVSIRSRTATSSHRIVYLSAR
jgi:hypothetical protein